jgi:anti-anti-sigma factor
MLTIGIHYIGTVASIDIRGKLVKGQGGHQLQILTDKVLTAGTTKVILNLTDVPIIDSMGIGEIVRAYKRVEESGGRFKIVGMTERVFGTMRMTQLLDLIESHKTEEEALESFSKKKGKGKKQEEEAEEKDSDE